MSAPTIFSAPTYFQNEVKFARGLPRDQLVRELSAVFPVPLTGFRIWDAFQTLLTTPASDDLGLTAGAFGTGCPYLSAGDIGGTTSTRYARTFVQLPENYEAGQPVSLRVSGGTLTSIADTTTTVDASAYVADRDTLKTGSDLVTTAAQDIRNLVFADKDFVLTPTSLTPGTWLDIRVAVDYADTANADVIIPAIAAVELVMTIRG